jgi:DNA-binding CsgD family transcriptional regulator
MHDFAHASGSVASSWELNPELNRLYQEHYHTLDVWAQRISARPMEFVCQSESIWPLSEMKTTEIYNDLLVPAGIEHAMFAVTENRNLRLASVGLYRDRSQPKFTESDLQILHFLAPHLQRAFNLHLRFSELKACSSSFESALDMVPTGIALLGFRGEIIFMNRSARTLVTGRDGLLATSKGLRAEQQTESDLLTKMIRQAASTFKGQSISAGGILLISRSARPALQLLVSPIRSAAVQLSQSIAVVVFINDPLRSQRPPDVLLRALYGLTSAECRVALLLSDGHAPRRIADIVGVTENTVRSQIKSIYHKTGVKRQSELMRLLIANSGLPMHAK